jgi:V/A-type H+-transporting ATPase subunit D
VPESGEVLATRVAFLELKDERRLVQEGYELLDEKRVLLATEIMRLLRHHAELQDANRQLLAAALAALESAVGVHGFDDFTVLPKLDLGDALLGVRMQSFLGLELVEASLEPAGAASPDAPMQTTMLPSVPSGLLPRTTPEARACALAFRRLLERQVELAGCVVSLRRLVAEYVRTERRARALENVMIPEIDQSLRFIEEQLDAVDQEEAVRVRNAGARR